jgi:hypothetical protein
LLIFEVSARNNSRRRSEAPDPGRRIGPETNRRLARSTARAGTERSKVKTVYMGAGIAAAAGLLMGAVARPDLGGDDRPAGPQIMAGWAGVRSTGPFDDGATLASYKGKIPDYVLGTDFKASMAPPPMTAEPSRPIRVAHNDVSKADLPLTDAAYSDDTPDAPSYPSIEGGADRVSDVLPPSRPDLQQDPGQG